MKALVSLCLLVSCFFGCAFKSDNSDEIKRVQDANEKLQGTYDAISGVYRGTIKVGAGFEYPVSLNLYSVTEEVGRTSDGNVKSTPVLQGTLSSEQIQELYYPLTMRAEYHEENGRLSLYPAAKDMNSSDIRYHSFRGTTDGVNFSGKVTVPSGLQGDFSFVLQTKDTSYKPGPEKPEPGSPIYDDARTRFMGLAGTYCFKVETRTFEIRFDVAEQERPLLLGYLKDPVDSVVFNPMVVRLGSYRDIHSLTFSSNNPAKNFSFSGSVTRLPGNPTNPAEIQTVIKGDFRIYAFSPTAIETKKLGPNERCPAQ